MLGADLYPETMFRHFALFYSRCSDEKVKVKVKCGPEGG